MYGRRFYSGRYFGPRYFGDGSGTLVEVPDVVGETEAAGTATLEGDGFVVSVSTAYSPSVAAGLIISQDPEGGELAASGATVSIVVSLGPEPVPEEPIGGHFLPQKSYLAEQDEKRRKDEEELRQLLRQAAGIIEIVQAAEPAPSTPEAVERQGQLEVLAEEFEQLRQSELADLELVRVQTVAALTRTLEQMSGEIFEAIADSVIDLVVDTLTELIEEIAGDE